MDLGHTHTGAHSGEGQFRHIEATHHAPWADSDTPPYVAVSDLQPGHRTAKLVTPGAGHVIPVTTLLALLAMDPLLDTPSSPSTPAPTSTRTPPPIRKTSQTPRPTWTPIRTGLTTTVPTVCTTPSPLAPSPPSAPTTHTPPDPDMDMNMDLSEDFRDFFNRPANEDEQGWW